MAPLSTPITEDGKQENPFALDITTVESVDLAGLVNLTDDGCGSTCGACTTGSL
jgi:FxLD family lantipeptide